MHAASAPWLFALLILVLHIAGCASPAQRLDAHAQELGLRRVIQPGDGYLHVAYVKEGRQTHRKALHVYLDGDGTPWLRKRLPAADPTPRDPLTLDLMVLDPASAVYLGRPCYHGMKAPACEPELWTDKRYSEQVVRSMSVALESLAADREGLVLVGYSGGGTLAMLLAERQPKVAAVVTLAANLDIGRWAALHGQHGLDGSLNPANRPPLRTDIRQLHVAGENDDNVPPELVYEAVRQQPGVKFKVFPGQDHACCWRNVWPEVLRTLEAD